MRFSLQDMVRRTLAEAEMREKIAQAEGEVGPEDKKKDKKAPPDGSESGTPERNEESLEEKTSSAFVEKLASAVDYCNEHFIKEAVGEPEPAPVAKPKTTTVGPGIGSTSIPNTIDTPTTGTQSTNTGQATNNQLPTVPGSDPASPGQTNPETALETDINSPPGGSEDWTKTDKMKQAMISNKVQRARRVLAGAAKKTKDAPPAKGSPWKDRGMGAAAGLGLTGLGLGGKALYDKKKSAPKDDQEKQAAISPVVTDKLRAVGQRAGQLFTGSKAKAMKEQITRADKAGMGVTPDRMNVHKKELAKVWGTRAGAAAAPTAVAAKVISDKKKAPELDKAAQVYRVRELIEKMGADANNPASIKAQHNDVPPPATQAEEGVPSQPGEVSKQESMVGSNEKAMNYTKQQAKAVPKARMGEVLSEPAQKKSTDPVLHENLDAASGAGVKLASVEKVAAARSLLQKIAEEGAKEDASPEEKERALKLQEALKAKQKEKDACAVKQGSTMPLSGGY